MPLSALFKSYRFSNVGSSARLIADRQVTVLRVYLDQAHTDPKYLCPKTISNQSMDSYQRAGKPEKCAARFHLGTKEKGQQIDISVSFGPWTPCFQVSRTCQVYVALNYQHSLQITLQSSFCLVQGLTPSQNAPPPPRSSYYDLRLGRLRVPRGYQ